MHCKTVQNVRPTWPSAALPTEKAVVSVRCDALQSSLSENKTVKSQI